MSTPIAAPLPWESDLHAWPINPQLNSTQLAASDDTARPPTPGPASANPSISGCSTSATARACAALNDWSTHTSRTSIVVYVLEGSKKCRMAAVYDAAVSASPDQGLAGASPRAPVPSAVAAASFGNAGPAPVL